MANEIVFNPYNANLLMRNVLITPTEVLFHAPTKQTFDPRTIQQAIIIAEEMYIRPALGNAMYNEIATQKNKQVTEANAGDLQQNMPNGVYLNLNYIVNSYLFLNANYQLLWLNILWKLVAECVGLIAFPEGWVQFGADGVTHSVPTASPLSGGGVTSPDLASIKFMLDKKQMLRIDPLLNALKNYLCHNSSLYPLYTGCTPAMDTTNVDSNAPNYSQDEQLQPKRSNFVLGIYEDEDTKRRCR
jgi:hypothetical protein